MPAYKTVTSPQNSCVQIRKGDPSLRLILWEDTSLPCARKLLNKQTHDACDVWEVSFPSYAVYFTTGPTHGSHALGHAEWPVWDVCALPRVTHVSYVSFWNILRAWNRSPWQPLGGQVVHQPRSWDTHITSLIMLQLPLQHINSDLRKPSIQISFCLIQVEK